MKHAVRQMLWYVRQDSTWLSIYLKHKISVIASKGKTMAECLRSHIRLARSFTQDQISHTTKDQRKLFLSRSDCAKVGDYWGLLIEHDHKHICDHVSAQLSRVGYTYKIKQHSKNCGDMFSQHLYERCLPDVWDVQMQTNANNVLSSKSIAVLADKDCRRRIFMSKHGYLWRLARGYFLDREFYKVREDLTVNDIVKNRKKWARALLPQADTKRIRFGELCYPYAYHNYKAKCLGPEGLECQKNHCHEREIVSNMFNPLKPRLREIATAIRVIKKKARSMCGLYGICLRLVMF